MSDVVSGMWEVRPPNLNFIKKKDTDKYTEYLVKTNNINENRNEDDPNYLTNYLNSFIYCSPEFTIKIPKKEYMIKKDGTKRFAYTVGMFPAPKTKKASYLDGCILAALGLKRQKTNADVICFITHDISASDKKKLEVVFDKVIYVPYISPYDMGGKGDLKTIMMDPGIFDNCPGYTKMHPYTHVFFKLHIFNPKIFPYEKVCFVDSDLVPMNYYDSLFMLDCPAGWVEYRKKIPYLESFHWDRCDFLKHGEKIPKAFTDVDTPAGADVNAGLLLVKPDKKEYDSMIKELKQPIEKWMGDKKYHRGFYSFDFDSPQGNKFVKNSYCFPEQNYLTKRFSGKWNYIEFAFQSWALDPCNAFGIHMAAFNPKPWFKQPKHSKVSLKDKITPYNNKLLQDLNKKDVRLAVVLKEDTNKIYENITYSYEIFNEVIIWGMVNYPKLKDFFVHNTEIHGEKMSFDLDKFNPLGNSKQFMLLKDIKKGSKYYSRLSKTQQQISDLINDYDKSAEKIRDKYLQICKGRTKNKYGKYEYDYRILEYPDYIDKSKSIFNKYLSNKQYPFGKFKGVKVDKIPEDYIKYIVTETNVYKNNEGLRKMVNESKHSEFIKKLLKENKKGGKTKRKPKKTSRKSKKTSRKPKKTLLYFYADYCPYCRDFNELFSELKKNHSNLIYFKKIDLQKFPDYKSKYDIDTIPALFIKENKVKFDDDRTKENLVKFIKQNC